MARVLFVCVCSLFFFQMRGMVNQNEEALMYLAG